MIPTGATFGPVAFMAAWAGGLAFTLPLAVRWKVAKRGYQLLVGGVVALLMIYPAVRSWWAAAGLVVVLIGVWRSGRREFSPLMVTGAVLVLISSVTSAGWLSTISGAAALGGITATMLLGHWFLVDPTLPRWALRRLDLLAGAGLILDLGAGWLHGAVPFAGGVLGWALAGLALISVALVVATWFALGETGYPGVMAATGLSYLGVVTVAGVVFLDRLMV